jgi:flagellar hook-length control protein FliK
MTPHASRRTETGAPARDASPDAALPILPTALNDSSPSPTALAQPTTQPVTTIAPAIPTVDLSASLGAQVVDMGVSGQWIDGLARDIAGLSANGAQGRFQINATELGPVEVNIRQGDDGVAISLTVATEAAEQALRQDSDRLKLDAGLSALRVSEVKVERAPHVAEATRADSSTNQNNTQQQSGGNSQNPGQAAGQNMGQSSAQSHMQGRGQQRENIAFGHKAGNDGAVLNHMDAGDTAGGAVRARYA